MGTTFAEKQDPVRRPEDAKLCLRRFRIMCTTLLEIVEQNQSPHLTRHVLRCGQVGTSIYRTETLPGYYSGDSSVKNLTAFSFTYRSSIMKINLQYTFVAALLVAIISFGNSGGRAAVAGQGNTGAPGDAAATCISCHGNNSSIQVRVDIALTDTEGNAIERYVPGTTYRGSVTVSALQGNPAAYGFQAVALAAANGQNGSSINTFTAPSANTQISNARNGRQYVEQNRSSRDSIFRFEWTVPTNTSGPITFYACGNGVNGNGGTSGDNADCSTLQITESAVSVTTIGQDTELRVAPNPVQRQINLSVNGTLRGPFTAQLFDVAGKQWFNRQVTLSGGSQSLRFPAEQLPRGLYFLQLVNGREKATLRVIKQ